MLATFNYQVIGYAGTDISYTVPTGGALSDGIPSTDDRGFFWIKNAAAGGTITVSVVIDGTQFGVANPDVAVTVPDGEERLIGPFTIGTGFVAAGGGIGMSITPNVTGVTAAAVKVP